jgi:mannitol/fructose-specific phosphotransferase system IIA component (Ntr-type)
MVNVAAAGCVRIFRNRKQCGHDRSHSASSSSVTTIAHYTSPQLILPELHTSDAAGVIEELCSLLHREQRVSNPLAFYNAVMNREMLAGTATDTSWALPHARMAGLSRLSLAVGRSTAGIKWLGRERVQLVFLFAVPEQETNSYLTLVAAMARLSQAPDRCEQLLQAADGEAMRRVLESIPLREPQRVALRC